MRHLLFLGAGLLCATAAAAAPTVQVVYNYKPASGAGPFAGLLKRGDAYFTGLELGGEHGCSGFGHKVHCGSVFRLEPPNAQHAQWRGKAIYRFEPYPDGSGPSDAPILGGHGSLLVSADGGTYKFGALVELLPPVDGSSSWRERVIHSFDDKTDGADPGRPHRDAHGNVYLTTLVGGSANAGTFVKFSPPASGQGAWTETILHTFGEGSDGSFPIGSLRSDAQGNLFFVTDGGGTLGGGTVSVLSPPGNGGTSWSETILHNFVGSDGAEPLSDPIADDAGNLFGLTYLGGTYDDGVVYELSPPAGGGTQWTETVLYAFTGGTDGSSPFRGLVRDAAGNLFATTQQGGDLACRCGTLIKLSPPQSGQGAWTETTLYAFQGGATGATPGGITVEDNGNLLVPAFSGGAYNGGALLEFSNTGYAVKK